MKIEGIKGLGKILQIVLWIGMVLGSITLITLPLIINILHKHFDLFIIIIYPCGILFLIMTYYFIEQFKTLENDEPFDMINVIRLKKSMIICSIISLLTLIDLFISTFIYDYYTLQLKIALIFISILFFAVAIAMYIVSELLKRAIEYKEENDLTI